MLPGMPAYGMSLGEARHLLARTSFGPDIQHIEAFAQVSANTAVGLLLQSVRSQPVSDAPEWANLPPPTPRQHKNMDADERKAFRELNKQRAWQLKSWWYHEMLISPSPFTERMTLFWHNHFTSSLQKVRWVPLLYQQNLTLRKHALGNFRDLLKAMLRDPAMLWYLDNARSRKESPNENFARELLELFTLGEGHYSEADIKNAARALTGYTINRKTGKAIFRKRWHDNGEKQFLGQRGNFAGDDIIEIILQQPATAEFIVTKLWRAFISPQPDRAEVQRLADIFRDNDYAIKPLLQALLTSEHFWATANRAQLVKSPVDFLVGTVRSLRLPVHNEKILAIAGRRLGQDIFMPPNVKGWPGGNDWINAHTLALRNNIIQRVLYGKNMLAAKGMRKHNLRIDFRHLPADYATLNALLLASAPLSEIDSSADKQQLVQQILFDPVYQLK